MFKVLCCRIVVCGKGLIDSCCLIQEKKEQKTNFNEEFTFGTAGEIGLDSSQRNPVLINVDTDELADPSVSTMTLSHIQQICSR